MSNKNIVCLGGGNAMPKAVLAGLKNRRVNLSVICAMLDSGGSAGRLRKDYKIVSSGDIRRAFIALSNTSPVIENIFNYRFEKGELKGHNFANLFITALELTSGNYGDAFQEFGRLLNVSHKVLPATLDNANLCAVLENGKIISGEANIDNPKHNGNLRIKKVFLKPSARLYPKSAEAIKKADLIIIGPGDLYSSLAQILLAEGAAEAIRKSKAKKVYISNLMSKYGETNNFTVLDLTLKIEEFIGGKLDYIIYNSKIPNVKRLAVYKKAHPELINLIKIGDGELSEKKFIGADVVISRGAIAHDPKKIANIIIKILRNSKK
jgi:uncharacterized cofD-like protein